MNTGVTIENLHEQLSLLKTEVKDIQKQIAESNSLEEMKELSKLLIGTIQNIEHYTNEIALLKESGHEETISLHDLDQSSRYKYMNKPIRLTRDIYNYGCTKRIKKAGEMGTLENINSFHALAKVVIGKRTYEVSFSDFEVIL